MLQSHNSINLNKKKSNQNSKFKLSFKADSDTFLSISCVPYITLNELLESICLNPIPTLFLCGVVFLSATSGSCVIAN